MSAHVAIAAPTGSVPPAQMWEITFTSTFQEDLKKVPKHIYSAVNRLLGSLRNSPFDRIPNAKPLHGGPARFRARIAGRFRLLYQVFSKERRVTLVKLMERQDDYSDWPDRAPDGTIPPGVPVEGINPQPREGTRKDVPEDEPTHLADVEADHWLSEDELFLLQIPDEHRPAVLSAGTPEALAQTNVPAHLQTRALDYLTNPVSSQLGRLYHLAADTDADAIAAQPLEAFLLALDPEQKQMVQLPANRGPYLVKGGPGTGKTLVGLYRLKRLLDSDTPLTSFACLTYTNSLAGAAQAMLQRLLPAGRTKGLHVSTLDQLTYDLARAELGRAPSIWSDSHTDNCIQATLTTLAQSKQPSDRDIANVVGTLGVAYVREEIDHVIEGNNLCALQEYSRFSRAGRKHRFSQSLRQSFWVFYEAFRQRRTKARAHTWSSLRQIALAKLKRDASHSRFDFLFVDEVQDLSRVARQICIELVADSRFLFMTADTAQSIFIHPPSWAGTDPRLDLTGRAFPLRRNYRTTRQIADAIAPLRRDLDDGAVQSGPSSAVFTGQRPVWSVAPAAEHPEAVVDLVKCKRGSESA